MQRSAKFGVSPDAPLVAAAQRTLALLKLKPGHVFGPDPLRVDPAADPTPRAGEATAATAGGSAGIATKLHLHCLVLDQASFKKIRSPDVITYLKEYQPTYCN